MHHPHVVAIPGASSVAQVESNAAAADITLALDEYRALTVAAEGSTPEAFAKMIEDETKKWGDVIRATGVKLDQ